MIPRRCARARSPAPPLSHHPPLGWGRWLQKQRESSPENLPSLFYRRYLRHGAAREDYHGARFERKKEGVWGWLEGHSGQHTRASSTPEYLIIHVRVHACAPGGLARTTSGENDHHTGNQGFKGDESFASTSKAELAKLLREFVPRTIPGRAFLIRTRENGGTTRESSFPFTGVLTLRGDGGRSMLSRNS